jgi:hypothetical protein
LAGKYDNAHGSSDAASGEDTPEHGVDIGIVGKGEGRREGRNPVNPGRMDDDKTGDEASLGGTHEHDAAKVEATRERTDYRSRGEDELQGTEHEVEFVGDVFVGDASDLDESGPSRGLMTEDEIRPPSNLAGRRPERSMEDYGDISPSDVNVASSRNEPSRKGGKKSSVGRQVGGAALAGSVAGLVVAGPVLGVAAGGAAAYAAANVDNTAGDVARRSGEAVARAGDKAREINERHEVTRRTSAMARDAVDTARKIDERHKIVASTRKLANGMAERAREIDERHHVAEKSRDAVNRAAAAARDVEERHRVSSRAKNAAVNAMAKAKDVNEKHQVTEKTKTAAKLTMKQVARGVQSISKNMGGEK